MEMTKRTRKPEMRFEIGEDPEDQVPAAAPITGTLTVDDVLEYIGFGKFHWRISFISGFMWVADAMEIMIMAILSPQLRCEWRLESYQVALMSSVVFLAVAIGAPIWGIFCDKYGRRNGVSISTCSLLYFGLLSAFAPTFSWFLFLRFLVGIGIGGTPQALTVYSEFLPMTLRGCCLTLTALFWALGSIFEVLLALLVMPTLGWRWLLGLSTIPTGMFLIVNNWLPESPRFDMLSGHTAKALETLRYVAKQNGKPMPEAKIVTFKEDNRGQLKDLFAPEIRRTTLLLSLLWFCGSFCYYGIVMLTPNLLQSGDSCINFEAKAGPTCQLQCKYLTSDDYRNILWTSFADVPGPILLVFLLDRIGRKKSFALSFLMFSLFLLPMYVCLGSIYFTSLTLITRACIATASEIYYIYTPEVFPTQIRAWGFGFCAGIGKIGSLICPFVSEVMSSFSLYLTLSVYCGISLLAAIASLMLPIETRGMHLGDTNQNQDAKVKTTTGDYKFFSGERE